MSEIIFKGVSTRELPGVYVSKMPGHRRASMRYTEYYVKGRDGALHVDEGYSNMDIEATLVLVNARAEVRQLVNAWAMGSGKLILSDDFDKAYKASVRKEVRWTRQPGNQGFYDTVKITWDCDPYMYEVNESEFVFTSSGTIKNPGTAVAIPRIKVEGSGNATFTVGGQQVTIRGMSSGVPVFLDCENGYVYAASGAMEMVGEFPELPLGQSNVVIGANTSKLTITPHWRWI